MDYEACAVKIWNDLRNHDQRYGLSDGGAYADLDGDTRQHFINAVTEEAQKPSDDLKSFYERNAAGLLESKWGSKLKYVESYDHLPEPVQRKAAIFTNLVRQYKERFVG